MREYIPLDFSPNNEFLVERLYINTKYFYNTTITRNTFKPYSLEPMGDVYEILPMMGPTESFVWCFLLNMGTTFDGVPDFIIDIKDPVSTKKKKFPIYIPNKITSGRSIETYYHYKDRV